MPLLVKRASGQFIQQQAVSLEQSNKKGFGKTSEKFNSVNVNKLINRFGGKVKKHASKRKAEQVVAKPAKPAKRGKCTKMIAVLTLSVIAAVSTTLFSYYSSNV